MIWTIERTKNISKICMLTLFGAVCNPWNGRFSYSPGSDSRSAPSDDLPRAKQTFEYKISSKYFRLLNIENLCKEESIYFDSIGESAN